MTPEPLTPREVQQQIGFDDAALARLEVYVRALVKRQEQVNLVAPASLADVWRRHILDSAQLLPHIPAGTGKLIDLGSGAGFPGLVLAILGAAKETHLVEATQKKCAFLADVSRETNIPVVIHNCRIEALEPQRADVVTARALAPLNDLIPLVNRHKKRRGIALVMKGARVDEELTAAALSWDIHYDRLQSLSDASGVILKIGEIGRRHER